MERVNSWGREIKEKFSVSFKKDEEDIKLFLNEQPSPVEYLKVLVRKDMGMFSKNINPIKPIENNIEDIENKEDTDMKISDETKEKIIQMLNQ
ncbi:hypothetical protein [Intestinibacter sp.]|uniref:hypothetical protein n=1 Tax=Intestinibacter sp. TaxID=1965304 RepID=UPI0021FA726C|nr:MAG: hypothetical protein [Bacteriophage sp.]